jgi:Trp operon repressor
VSKTKKIVNMLADDTAAPAAARTLAKAAEQEGKLISDYLTERLQHDRAPPTSALNEMKAAATEAWERRPAKNEKFVPTEPRPSYREPREVTAMVLAYKEQLKLLDRLKLVVKAMRGLPPDTNFAQALAAAIAEGARALKVLEKQQEAIIAASIAARKASAEAYAIAIKAWEGRMER